MKHLKKMINQSVFLGVILILAGSYEIKSATLGMYGSTIASGNITRLIGFFVLVVGCVFLIFGIKRAFK